MSCVLDDSGSQTESTIEIKKKPFSVVPDDILEDKDMRPETRLVLAWLIGRPSYWIFRISYVIRILGLSKPRWARARREMEKNGYLTQKRQRTSAGRFVWKIVVSEVPDPAKKAMVRESRDGDFVDGKLSNITTPTKQKESNTPLYPPKTSHQLSSECYEEARRQFPGFDIYALEQEWVTWSLKQPSMPINPDKAFLAWIRTYVERNPLPYSARGGAK